MRIMHAPSPKIDEKDGLYRCPYCGGFWKFSELDEEYEAAALDYFFYTERCPDCAGDEDA